MNIFDIVCSPEIAAYWETMEQDQEPYIGEELFPDSKKIGLDLKWIKGSSGLPITLKMSAFDAAAVPRARIGFDRLSAEMPFFKESTYIDEELRQEMNLVLETGNQAYIDSVRNRVFDDEMALLRGARAGREAMRMMALTSGVVSLTSNGQMVTYDYGVSHKGTVTISWSDYTTSDPIEDMRQAMEQILDDTGEVVTRGICSGKTWRDIRNNDKVKKSIFVLSNGQATVSDARLQEYLLQELGLELVVNNKRYKDSEGNTVKYVPDDMVSLFPAGELGRTWFGTTPEESDLMSAGASNVSIVDTGTAVTTITKEDPVNVETKVTQICLPSFEMADSVYILDTKKE